MSRWLLVLLALGCGRLNKNPPSDDVALDSGSSKPVMNCEMVFDEAVDTDCKTDNDCVVLTHPDCCGPIEIGVAAVGLQQAQAAEAQYEPCETAQCGPVGCAHPVEAENGQTPGSGQSIVPQCAMGKCTTVVQ